MRKLNYFVLAISSLNIGSAFSDCLSDSSSICIVDENKLVITNESYSDNGRVNNFFGVHSLFWGTQSDLGFQGGSYNEQAVSILKNAHVSSIRYGGGVNEIDWQDCLGDSRTYLKLATWLPAVRCMFGVNEYEKLNENLDINTSWHIANPAGIGMGVISDIDLMSQKAAEYASYVKSIAPDRIRYWEIGNELERGNFKWNAETIANRSLPIANAIIASDSDAKVVIPLIEYQPDWISSQSEHNKYLARSFLNITNVFSLHTYYDNAPEGPSIKNRIQMVSDAINDIKSQGIAQPSIWITEHARWPYGTSLSNWSDYWYQTSNFDGMISTSDFLIGLTQLKYVSGAMWHGLRAGPWNFIIKNNQQLSEGFIAKLYEYLYLPENTQTLKTISYSKKNYFYTGGYNIRGSAFKSSTDGRPVYIVWLVNRSNMTESVALDLVNLGHQSGVYSETQLTLDSNNNIKSIKPDNLITKTTDSIAVDLSQVNNISFPSKSLTILRFIPN